MFYILVLSIGGGKKGEGSYVGLHYINSSRLDSGREPLCSRTGLAWYPWGLMRLRFDELPWAVVPFVEAGCGEGLSLPLS